MNAPTYKDLRQLDDWIAEHVMGWESECRGEFVFYWPPEPNEKSRKKSRREFKNGICVPYYSSKNDSAMTVLEKLLKKDEEITVSFCLDDKQKYSVISVRGFQPFVTDEEIVAATLPLAICLLAKQLFSK